MAFTRDHGTCCLFLPLKLGVGIIAMVVFMHSVLCILALFTGDVRFQPNGYSQFFYHVPSIVGILGLVFGFMGLIAIYDDNLFWMRAFRNFLFFKLFISAITIWADYQTLRRCDSWLSNPTTLQQHNIQMEELAKQGLCPWARVSYFLGGSVDLLFWGYCCFQMWAYLTQLELNPPYPIDFGNERFDKEGRWRFYQVKDPFRGASEAPLLQEKVVEEGYGTTEKEMAQGEEQPLLATAAEALGMQDEPSTYEYGPDGMAYGQSAPLPFTPGPPERM